LLCLAARCGVRYLKDGTKTRASRRGRKAQATAEKIKTHASICAKP
jgi:hypothetical protein